MLFCVFFESGNGLCGCKDNVIFRVCNHNVCRDMDIGVFLSGVARGLQRRSACFRNRLTWPTVGVFGERPLLWLVEKVAHIEEAGIIKHGVAALDILKPIYAICRTPHCHGAFCVRWRFERICRFNVLMKKIALFLCVLALLVTSSSCSMRKPTLAVFKDLQGLADGSIPLPDYEIKLRPQDELFISVSSTEPSATAPYNLPLSNPGTRDAMLLSQTPKQQTYIVNQNGDINFPELGVIHVEGLTTMQLAESLTERISREVKDPLVRVELVNFTVDVVGEVRKPAKIKVSTERFSILDALASAEHMTEYGDRTNVLVIREKDGKAEYHTLDLTKSDVVSSPYFYLQQNDVVMVAPTKARESNARYDTNNSYRMQIVSTIVSACSVIASLVIALAIK